jgi:hypothetical protein
MKMLLDNLVEKDEAGCRRRLVNERRKPESQPKLTMETRIPNAVPKWTTSSSVSDALELARRMGHLLRANERRKPESQPKLTCSRDENPHALQDHRKISSVDPTKPDSDPRSEGDAQGEPAHVRVAQVPNAQGQRQRRSCSAGSSKDLVR